MTHDLDDDDADIELIEKYHRGLLAGAELEHFLSREKGDKDFAQKVRSYTEIFEGIQYYGKQQAFADTILEWEKEIKEASEKTASDNPPTPAATQEETPVIPIKRKNIIWLSIAASVAFIIVFLTLLQNESPEELANNYIDDNLTTLSTTMAADADSLRMGVAAFNEQDYLTAERIFRSLEHNEELVPEVAEYLGITYLKSGNYDNAIAQFNKLISHTELHVNPGTFYLAITLMKRSQEGDIAEAEKLLNEVVAKKLHGQAEASKWLKKL